MNAHCNDTFTPLREVILGSVYVGNEEYIPDDDTPINDILKATSNLSLPLQIPVILHIANRELNQIQKVFESRGIKVHRPTRIANPASTSSPFRVTPYLDLFKPRIPLTPRDNLAIMNDMIVETNSWDHTRYFDTYYYRELMLEYFNAGSSWLAMPQARYDKFIDLDPQYDMASMIKVGKDIFTTVDGACNKAGLEWIVRSLPNYRFHYVDCVSGHIDCHITVLRPGLVMTHLSKSKLPDFFKTWDVINVDPRMEPEYHQIIDPSLQDEDFKNTVLAVNVLSLDEHTVMAYSHYRDHSYLLRQFDKFKIEPIFVDMTYSHFFNQGMTCLTLDTVRDGGFEDYS